jgi:hypothetical protein
VRCPRGLLTAQLLPGAHFVASVERDHKRLEYDASRKASYRVRRTACVHMNTMFASFEIEDDSGRATVLPEGAVIEGIEAVHRSSSSATLRRALGVVGKDRCIVAPEAAATGQRFLISVNSEGSRAAELGDKGKWMLGLGLVCLIGAVLCFGSAGWCGAGCTRSIPREKCCKGAACGRAPVSSSDETRAYAGALTPGRSETWRFTWFPRFSSTA